jgi:hypothetical protein
MVQLKTAELYTGKDLNGSNLGVIEVIFPPLPGETKKIHRKPN